MLRVRERPPFLFHTRLFDMVVVDGRLLTSVQYSFFSSMFSIFEFLLPFPFLFCWGVAITRFKSFVLTICLWLILCDTFFRLTVC